MAGTTSRYGLSTLESGDKLSDDDYKYTTRDRENIDAKLWLGAEGHVHDGASASLTTPSDPLGYTLSTTSGTIPASKSVRYKFTWVDSNGQETAASDEVVVTTPSQVASPDSPTLAVSNTGGTLLSGNYFYILTAFETSSTQESLTSTPVYISVPYNVTTGEVTITYPTLPTGADGFNIYKREPGSSQYHFLTSEDITATPATEYVDDGSVSVTCSRTLPRTNTTLSSNSIELSVPGATPTVADGATWKIYRTYQEGNWDYSLLAWVVAETSEGSGIITPTYTDTGTTTSQGSPPSTSSIVGSPAKVILGEHTTGSLPPGQLTGVDVIEFSEPGPIEVKTGNYVWICPYEQFKISEVYLGCGRNTTPGDTIRCDVNWYDSSSATPSWTTIFTDQNDRPTLSAGDFAGATTMPAWIDLAQGDGLSIDIDDSDEMAATPTGEDLVVYVVGYYKYGSETESIIWE